MDKQTPQKKRGFSALELAAAIAVVALILFFAWPHFQQRRTALLGEDLKKAAEAGDREAIMKALKRGAPPDAWSGASPHYCLRCKAIIDNDLDMLRYLLDLDAQENLDKPSHYHRMLFEAIQHENIDALEELLAVVALASQAPIDVDNGSANVLLHAAIEKDDVEILRTLLDYGLPTNSKSYLGDTPLHAAAHGGNIEAIETLLAFGADVTVRNSQALLPKDVANYECRTEIQQMLAVPGR